jgi:hypothetical protein
LADLLEETGFIEVATETVDLPRRYETFDAFLEETIELSSTFRGAWSGRGESERAAVRERIRELTRPFTDSEGRLDLPARALMSAAGA